MMRKNLAGFLVVLLVLALLLSSYSLWNCRKDEESLLKALYLYGLKDARELSDVGGTFDYLLRENASDNLIVTYAHAYSIRAEHLQDTFGLLQAYTDDERFQLMFSAMSNYHLFLQVVSFSNSTTRKVLIGKNLETLKELDNLMKNVTKYQSPNDLPEELVEEILHTSEELEV
ncbi:hypothetical protein A3K92_02500 [Thermococcus gorgonarius]|uniref:Uncharacterized protein n=2 Tax=Thermococcus gorgonarius TaxID=71997 RepID=A0A2Z2M3V1_THEGO|nr:hypothetical protein A3K92_02500 [Thermococcus gorgonarius]